MSSARTFSGRDVRAALAAVERVLGPDARIVSTSTDARGVTVVAEPAGLAPLRRRFGAAPWRDDARAFGLPDAMLSALTREFGHADPRSSRNRFATRLASRIGIAAPFTARCQALVGPTGVGKTTTIAKLATQALASGRPVRLLTLDVSRPGGVEQIDAHARALGLALDVATTTREFASQAAPRDADELVLIDTAGRAPHDRAARDATIRALGDAEAGVLLCLQAATRRADAAATLASWRSAQPAALVITKWDETDAPGEVVALAIERQLPLAWITVGQRVPEDIVPADARAIAAHAAGLDEAAAAELLAE